MEDIGKIKKREVQHTIFQGLGGGRIWTDENQNIHTTGTGSSCIIPRRWQRPTTDY